MAELIKLDGKKRVQLFLKKMKEGGTYRFSVVVKSKVLPKGEDKFRSTILSFFGGVYAGYAKEEECLIFIGTPLHDIGRMGECKFLFSIDEKATLTLIDEKVSEK